MKIEGFLFETGDVVGLKYFDQHGHPFTFPARIVGVGFQEFDGIGKVVYKVSPFGDEDGQQ